VTVYAASSIVYVAVSPEHGGCGESHVRPVVQGAPAKVWGLECPRCEDHLRSDPHWSPVISKIPETFDEKLTREDFEKRGVLDERALMAMALARLTGLELPETLRARITGSGPGGFVPGTVECGQGHENRPGSKFCAECGAVMREAEPTVLTCANGHENAASAKFCAECGDRFSLMALPAAGPSLPDGFASLPANQLRALAKERGLDASGTKADVLSRLQAA